MPRNFRLKVGGPSNPRSVIRLVLGLLAAAGDEHTAARMLAAATVQAETLRLPHQVQRIIRITAQPGVLPDPGNLRARATEALARLREQLSEARPA